MPEPGPAGRKLSLADRRRLLIVARAAALFDVTGYNRTTMDDIARAADMAKPTLYHYFRSKDDILFAIHEEFMDLLIVQHERRTGAVFDAVDSLRALIGDILGLMQTHHGHVRVFFEHHRQLSTRHQIEIAEKRSRYQAFVYDIVARGMETGQFRSMDPTLTALGIFGMCNWAYQWYSPDGPFGPDEIAERFADLLQQGLYEPGR